MLFHCSTSLQGENRYKKAMILNCIWGLRPPIFSWFSIFNTQEEGRFPRSSIASSHLLVLPPGRLEARGRESTEGSKIAKNRLQSKVGDRPA